MDDADFLREFESRALPFERWSHRAHVRVAYLNLRRLRFDAALSRIREGIVAYHAATGVPEGPRMGYHETVTHAWVRIIAAAMHHYGPGERSEEFCAEQPHLLHRTLLRLFYTRERLSCAEAKGRFVEPDIARLPPARDQG